MHGLKPDEDGLDPFFWPVHFQQARGWVEEARGTADLFSRDPGCLTATIAVCRWLDEQSVGQKGVGDQHLSDVEIAHLLRMLDANAADLAVMPLAPDECVVRLERYVSDHLVAGGACMGEDALLRDFIALYRALLVVAASEAEHSVLERIALDCPVKPPGFGALDLWLKRRAAQCCLERDGVRFVIGHLAVLRLEDIAALLAYRPIPASDLPLLEAALRGRDWSELYLTNEDIANVFASLRKR